MKNIMLTIATSIITSFIVGAIGLLLLGCSVDSEDEIDLSSIPTAMYNQSLLDYEKGKLQKENCKLNNGTIRLDYKNGEWICDLIK